MPFSSTGSITSTDLNNMLRGLYRDNASHAVTGTATETDMATVTITANTIGATGALLIMWAGTTAGTNDTKEADLYFGGTNIGRVANRQAADTIDWAGFALMTNTAANAQRWMIFRNETVGVTTTNIDYTTSAIDTASNQILKITGDLNNTGDTITQTMFDVFIVQIS